MDYQGLTDDDLVCECGERPCPEAWEEFIRRFHRLIAGAALRVLRQYSQARPETIEDMVQNTFAKLCANDRAVLRRFQPQHPNAFRGLLKRVTVNVVYDFLRKPENPENTEEVDEAVNPIPDPRPADFVENQIFFDEVDALLRRRPTEEKERAIFWLYYRHGLTAKAIASIPAMDLSVKGVESTIFRLTSFVKQSVAMGKPSATPRGIQAAGTF